jgi:hypothetical protein
MDKIDQDFELGKQLHEQYAINTNERTSSFVSFVGALLALFAGFGYVFVYTVPHFSKNGILKEGHDFLTIEVFLLIALITAVILFFLSLVSLQLGFSSRRDHIIIHNIRKKYFSEEHRQFIFGNSYNPDSKDIWNFLPDYFNMFYWLFFVGIVAVIALTLLKYIVSISANNNCVMVFHLTILNNIVVKIQIIFVFLSFCYRNHYFDKYKTINSESTIKYKKKTL